LDQAQTSAAPGLAGYPQGRFEKAKPSTVATAIPGPSPSFLATQNGREPVTMYEWRLGRPQVPVAEGGPVGFSDGGGPTGLVPRGPGAGGGLSAARTGMSF
jgi:hypothetical protein